jgi:uncharacterized protein with GYD domain
MAIYVMFGTYSSEALRAVSSQRTDDAAAVIKKHGGELKAVYALLGEVDLVVIVDLPDIEHAMQTSVALNKLLGISFRTAPAVSIEAFDKLMT